jgi:phospholipid/cholesterol/gamma-HCH transport system ATP-binding protein
MNPAAVIRVRKLVARYGQETILDNVSFDVNSGEIFVVLGGSGCGKSTLLRHIIGLEAPAAGEVRIAGVDITRCSEAQYRGVLRRIGVLFQGSALFGAMTVGENIALPISEYTDLQPDDIEMLVAMKLRMVGLEGYADRLPSELSGGMKKRAGLARAMALNPQILFLDEPSAGLDPITSAEIDDLILFINRSVGTTMVIVTHELESIFRVSQRVIMLAKSARGIIAEGDVRDLQNNSSNELVQRFFQRQAGG